MPTTIYEATPYGWNRDSLSGSETDRFIRLIGEPPWDTTPYEISDWYSYQGRIICDYGVKRYHEEDWTYTRLVGWLLARAIPRSYAFSVAKEAEYTRQRVKRYDLDREFGLTPEFV